LDESSQLTVTQRPRFVSRGGEKLVHALESLPIQVEGKICADVGASTGGFTDCLLQYGAAKVYAIDVGRGQLEWSLRQDDRVVVMERQNARHIEGLPDPIDLVTIDASFISLKLLLPVVKNWLAPGGQVIALVKPQFEAGKAEADRGRGVITDPAVHQRVLSEVLPFADAQGFSVRGLLRSPIMGPKGNVEFLLWMDLGEEASPDIPDLIDAALEE
jgi:23S rRNA (cytidine1920-2'-O)/16S rRNA (cytidine1409-2'-O)-methyltransferase